jgi:hypothetical protein
MLGFHSETALQGCPGMFLISSSELWLPGRIHFKLSTELEAGLILDALGYSFPSH